MSKRTLQDVIYNLPPGLDRAILRILAFYKGRRHTIGRKQLIYELKIVGFDVHERAIRACINQLRKDGHTICSTGGPDGGYYMAADWNELNEYLEREVHGRAMDLLEQEKALRAAGEKTWGALSPEKQMGLGV
ncbi:MAG: hypothetical protein JW908_00445 [Anaerolineales bacterium]|nr:hypothetical protein [Anaerolineales bacterium]